MSLAMTQSTDKGWEAKLDLSFSRRDQKTILTGKKHSGPLLVQKPFYPEANGCCHIYLIHPPGGIVGGDYIHLTAKLEESSHALITTPGATKFYRSIGPIATQKQEIHLADNASLEWLPQETVFYNQANANALTSIHLNENNRFFAWEIQCLGLPAQKEFFTAGQCTQKFEIWKGNRPVLLETNRLNGDDDILLADWGLQGEKALGTFVISDQNDSISTERITQILEQQPELTASYTRVNGLLIVRALSTYAEIIKQLFTQLWQTLRPDILDIKSSAPRIWLT